MSHSPATPDKAGKHTTKSSPNVIIPFVEKLTSTSKVKQASINEPSPASTYGDTVGSSCPATPQDVVTHDPVAGLTESLRAAQIDPAIESISGSPMPTQNTKTYSKMSEIYLSPSKTGSIDTPRYAVSANSSPSSDRLNAIRKSPSWRGNGKGNYISFVRQSTVQPDDPFVSNNSTSQPATQAFSPRGDRAGVPVTNDNAQALLPPEACIFVANLTSTQSDEQLEHHVHKAFCHFGNCYVKIRRDPSSMPFAFVQYETEAEAQQAVRKGRGMAITGRECRTEIARVNRSLYLSRVAGGHISEEEARQVLSKFGPIQKVWYASETDQEMYRLPDGIWARFSFFQDCRDAQGGFRDNSVYRLEQPRLPEDIHTRIRSRQYRVSSNVTGFSPIQRRSPGRMLPSPMRSTRTDLASIFVGNLPPEATQEGLRQVFQIYGQVLHVDVVHKPSMNNDRINAFAFIEFLSPEMASAAVHAGPQIYGNAHIRVERKQSVDPFARRDALMTDSGSPLNRYPHDMAMQFQRGLVAGMAQAAQSMPAPPVYGGYSYYQPYDGAPYNQFAAPVNSFGTSPAVDGSITGTMAAQSPGQYQYGHQLQVSTPALNQYQYAQTSSPYTQQPPRQVYQWPPANTGNDGVNDSPSH